MLKLMLIIAFCCTPAFADEMGEDVTNLDCQKSIHQPRELMASIKTIELDESSGDDEDIDDGSRTLSK